MKTIWRVISEQQLDRICRRSARREASVNRSHLVGVLRVHSVVSVGRATDTFRNPYRTRSPR